ncbi:hypothetical protein GO730_34960 [Spirosoma sp. HMF3257]|uniref:Uncharacterized protein n=1 Tax=Spirosoma telluris TaxID=2183553 RepID=A0A327NYP0_9BACT|nr:hypothetical protein [Spirosoma telluris]RAI77988.1 hypothetical protein HMF3257_34860 [Spirosoma telluris]
MHNITIIPEKSQISNDIRKKAPNVDDLQEEIILESDLFRKLSGKPIQLSFIPTKEMPIDLSCFYEYFKLSEREINHVKHVGPLRSIIRMHVTLNGLALYIDL